MLRREAYRLVSVLERGAHRLALKLKRKASQACICVETWSYTGSRFNVEMWPWGLRLKEQHDHCVWQRLRGSRLRLEHDICVWQRMRGLRLDWDATSVSARFASEALSSVIFRQPTGITSMIVATRAKSPMSHQSSLLRSIRFSQIIVISCETSYLTDFLPLEISNMLSISCQGPHYLICLIIGWTLQSTLGLGDMYIS